MKILLINPSLKIIRKRYSFERCPHIYPPLSLLYLASYLLKHSKHKVEIFDSDIYNIQDESLSVLKNKIHFFKPNIIGLTMNTIQANDAFVISRMIKEKFNLPIIVGGPHASALPIRTLQECSSIDYLVIGEGEKTLLDLLNAIENNNSLKNINGLVYRSNNQIIKNDLRERFNSLESIPFPAYDLLELTQYFNKQKKRVNPIFYPSLCVMTSRGCPYKCFFCANPVWNHFVTYRNVIDVIDEIEMLNIKYNVKGIYFHDDTFNLKPTRVYQICNEFLCRYFYGY